MPSLRRPETLDEMSALLVEYGLDAELVHTCRIAAALVEDPAGRSRIGGLPRLAEGVRWPEGVDGPIPHVASIRLEDLPESVRPAVDGELAIFVGANRWWAEEPDANFAVLHTPASELGEPTPSPVFDVRQDREGMDHARAQGRPAMPAWNVLPLAARRVVAMPWAAGMPWADAVGEYFSEDDADGFSELAEALEEAEQTTSERGHLVLGDVATISDDAPGEPPVLIQLSSSRTYEDHGSDWWVFGDVWHLLLRGDPGAFHRGDFSSLTIDYAGG